MPWTGGRAMTNEFLPPLRRAFLRRFFSLDVGAQFFLTGGTALAAFYLHHRLSYDLDLFTLDDAALPEVDRHIEHLATELGCTIARARRTEHFRQFLLQPQDEAEPSLQVDLVRDVGPQYGQRQVIDGIVVDAMENIAANKVVAILGRTEAKDFVDLYFILQAGYDFADLFEKAQRKDLGLMKFYFAGALLQVNKLTRLPEMRKPLDLPALQTFFTTLANDILDQLNPNDLTPWERKAS